jgi:hypothetical protein
MGLPSLPPRLAHEWHCRHGARGLQGCRWWSLSRFSSRCTCGSCRARCFHGCFRRSGIRFHQRRNSRWSVYVSHPHSVCASGCVGERVWWLSGRFCLLHVWGHMVYVDPWWHSRASMHVVYLLDGNPDIMPLSTITPSATNSSGSLSHALTCLLSDLLALWLTLHCLTILSDPLATSLAHLLTHSYCMCVCVSACVRACVCV